MTVGATALLRVAAELIATLLLAIPAIWGALALWYQAPSGPRLRTFSAALWSAVCVVWTVALWRGRFASGLAGFASDVRRDPGLVAAAHSLERPRSGPTTWRR